MTKEVKALAHALAERFDDDTHEVPDQAPMEWLCDALAEPSYPMACCGIHWGGSLTSDRRYWCWRPDRPCIAPVDDDLVGQIGKTAARWRQEMERQLAQRDSRMNRTWNMLRG
jgi:hypothetical protein